MPIPTTPPSCAHLYLGGMILKRKLTCQIFQRSRVTPKTVKTEVAIDLGGWMNIQKGGLQWV